MTAAQIETERFVKTSSYQTHVDKGKRMGVTIMPDGDEVPSGAWAEYARGPIGLDKSVVNTGHRIIHTSALYRNHSTGSLWRDQKTGSVFVAKDKLDEFFLQAMKLKKYTEKELIAMNHSNEEGWKTSNGTPLGFVKEKLKFMEQPEKWLHFKIPQMNSVLALFFSPTKDRWFYVDLIPETGECKRTIVYGSKEVAEFKRKKRILTWIPLTNKQTLLTI